jgi:hypothetical protein
VASLGLPRRYSTVPGAPWLMVYYPYCRYLGMYLFQCASGTDHVGDTRSYWTSPHCCDVLAGLPAKSPKLRLSPTPNSKLFSYHTSRSITKHHGIPEYTHNDLYRQVYSETFATADSTASLHNPRRAPRCLTLLSKAS